ncbi:MAG TPA: response regulator transcription factor [Candidatus Binatia bacterium]|nr:response regulator transcription factor [Candidatus Binatia bacterium]
MSRPRLLLADDHRLVLEGLQRLLEPEFEVAGLADDGRALLDMARRVHPDVILLDISMPFLNGIDAARQVRRICPKTKLIFVTMHTERNYVKAAFQAGCSGYVLKSSAPRELATAIRAVMRGGSYLPPGIRLDPAKLQGTAHGLTPRQREVLQLIAEGRSNKQIATLLRISIKGVEYHKSAIASVLGTNKPAELTRYAISAGLIDRYLT